MKDLLLYAGIGAVVTIGFLIFTEPGKNILRALDQLYTYGKVIPGLDTADELRAYEKSIGRY
jgi:hypothetical protein